jgi:ABC-type glycerol-3-phosphate transport system substrate-binding protein
MEKLDVENKNTPDRRVFLKGAGLAALAAPYIVTGRAAAQAHEIVHWSWLAASDGEVWAKMIDNFNAAHKGKVSIRLELVPDEQYTT